MHRRDGVAIILRSEAVGPCSSSRACAEADHANLRVRGGEPPSFQPFSGPGRFSIDALLGLTSSWTPLVTWGALLVAVLSSVVNLALRRTPASA